ncbi:MAG: hypothetical protein K8T91_25525 [Planctomycetes bacterium]|nr:hypothetical protein [Planctomycetota bacterium]
MNTKTPSSRPVHRALLLLAVPVLCAAAPADRPRQSLPPKEWDKSTRSVFPANPRSLLRGERPALRGGKDAPANTTPGDPAPTEPGKFAWSKIISAETATNEIKSARAEAAENVRNLGVFKAGGHRQLRRQFSVLAVMFGIIAEYDQSIRWKQNAAGARAAFAKAAINAKAADDNTFNEAKARSQNLDDLVQGGSAEFPPPPNGDVKWPDVAERRQLMLRLDVAFEKRLRPAVADAAQLTKNRDQSLHEAEMIAALAEIVGREGYESADDAEYQKHAKQLKQWALAAAAAVRDNNLGEAQRAVGMMGKACSECHGAFK